MDELDSIGYIHFEPFNIIIQVGRNHLAICPKVLFDDRMDCQFFPQQQQYLD